MSSLDNRSKHLLKVMVEHYIEHGQPVASKTLAEESKLSVSAATIRNVMAELEEEGYVESPHTSAGRVPTVRGYRYFVDSLLRTPAAHHEDLALELKQNLAHGSTSDMIQSTSNMLSGLTQMAGIVTIPQRSKVMLRHVEFLPLSDNRVLVILVLNEKEVENRIIFSDRPYTASELEQAANFLNQHFAGKELLRLRQDLLASMRADKEKFDSIMQTALDVADKAFASATKAENDYVMAGASNLIDIGGSAGIDGLKGLFDEFTQKENILYLLDACINADGIQIYIGNESGYDTLGDCSIVTSKYEVDGETLGVLGVIGPTRMHYDKVIPIVDVTAKLLSEALK